MLFPGTTIIVVSFDFGSAARRRSEEHTSELQSPVHLVYLRSFPTRRSSDLAEIEMLQGQLRAMRCVIAALITSSPNIANIMESIAVMQSDLLTEFDAVPRNDDHRRQLRLWERGAEEIGRAHV